jgi:hypothetical protein
MTKIVPIHEPSIAYHAPAGSFNHGSMTPVRVVLHDTECHDAAGITEIEGVVHFWMQTSAGNRLGAHYLVDADGNVGKLADGDTLLYHVGGLNTGSIGIEQIGFASFTEADWLRRPDQLSKVAKLLAYLHHEYGIPLSVPMPQGASKANHGVMTHAMVSRFESASPGADPTPPPPQPAKAQRPAGAVIHYTDRHGKRQTQTLKRPILWQNTHSHAWWHGPFTIVPRHKK